MVSVTIELPDDQAAALKAKLAAQGLTLEEWFGQMAAQHEASTEAVRRQKQAAAARIREIQHRTKPDPEGWTIRDYINYGRR